MEKRFKLRICRVITTTLQSCRSNDPSQLPQDPLPLSSFNLAFSDQNHHRPSSKRQGSSSLVSAGTQPEGFKWMKDEKWHVIAKIHEHPTYGSPRRKKYNSAASESDDSSITRPPSTTTPPPSSAEKQKRRGKKKRRNIPTRLRVSTSSADSGLFSSGGDERDEEEETETLVSSSISCLSTDSSSNFISHHQLLQPIHETRLPVTSNTSFSHHRKKHSATSNRRRTSTRRPKAAAEVEIPARLSMLKKLIPCTVEGKVKESFAVVKRSANPYEDFKNSMMDMIVEKQIFEAKDLEQLLQCFLSLNSRHFHGIIVEAFSEMWDAIFSQTT